MGKSDKIEKVKTPVYLWDDYEELMIKFVPGVGFFAKFPCGDEFKIEETTDAVVRAIAANEKIPEALYRGSSS